MEMSSRIDASLVVVSGEYVLRLLRVVLLLTIWRTLFAGKGAVNGMDLHAVLTYTLVFAAFQEQFDCRTKLQDALWSGAVANQFLQPMGLFHQFTARTIGGWLPALFLFSIPIILLSPLLGVSPLPSSSAAGAWFLISLLLAISVGLALDYAYTALMLMLGQDIYSVNCIRNALALILSGAMIPLALFPWGMGSVIEYLPFASMTSAPLRIFTGTGNPLPLLAGQAAWSIALWPLAFYLWSVGRERLACHGG
jgi:ABC-2 type transport system permease protein